MTNEEALIVSAATPSAAATGKVVADVAVNPAARNFHSDASNGGMKEDAFVSSSQVQQREQRPTEDNRNELEERLNETTGVEPRLKC